MARNGDEVLGCVGLESSGRLGLLRSLAVREGAWKQGIGSRLCTELETQAKSLGIRDLYLLTTTAQEHFVKRGYAVRKREDAPEWIRRHPQFTSLCPSSAVLMRKEL